MSAWLLALTGMWEVTWGSAAVGVGAVGGASLVGALAAPGLVRLARSGAPLRTLARRGVRIAFLSLMLAYPLLLILWGWEPGLLSVLGGFALVSVGLSPLYLVGAAAAMLYGAIVRSERWTAPPSPAYISRS